MPDVVIDTDVASVLQKNRAPAWLQRHVAGQRVWLTFVTAAELWKWAEVRSCCTTTRDRLDSWIAARPIIPCDHEIARTWARLAAGAQQRGRPRPQNDTWIAACCLRHELPLITLNRKDFEDFANHDGLVLLGPD
jgi:predicted nucleic acid-binding protein